LFENSSIIYNNYHYFKIFILMPLSTISTKFGKIKFSTGKEGISSITFPSSKKKPLPKHPFLESLIADDAIRKRLITEIEKYFMGEKPNFDLPLDLRCCSPFQRKVYNAARKIPYGKVRTYGWIARKIGKPMSSRAVGQALGKNPIPLIIP
jgi:methylated-DNA-[protein]-cysteine S-methyltransferase